MGYCNIYDGSNMSENAKIQIWKFLRQLILNKFIKRVIIVLLPFIITALLKDQKRWFLQQGSKLEFLKYREGYRPILEAGINNPLFKAWYSKLAVGLSRSLWFKKRKWNNSMTRRNGIITEQEKRFQYSRRW